MGESMIDVRDLVVRLGSPPQAVVRRISFAVPKGGCYGLVGESGCGKSTVLRAISGLNPEYQGEIAIAGATVPHVRPRGFYRTVQMVFQDPYGSLHPRKTIGAQLLEPLRNQGLPRTAAAIIDALTAVGLDPALRYRYPHQLSGGQRQRVAIARALILDADVLLLDEPTSALDVSVQAEILNLLSRLRCERGLTYIMVSHNLAVVAHLCERIAVMNRGRFVEELTSFQLRTATAQDEYTRQLIAASGGYDREAARRMVTYE
jgi:peptide/nickel transport system ATP-binding protein